MPQPTLSLRKKCAIPNQNFSRIEIALLFIFYGFTAAVFNIAATAVPLRNPDGFAYLRLAGYLAQGEFWRSVTAYWGPLITWLTAPLLALRIDGLTALTAVRMFGGGVFLAGILLLTLRFKLEKISRSAAVLITTFFIAHWTSLAPTPDILLAAILAFYFYGVLDPGLPTDPRKAFHCGLLAGTAYLAKHFALPFFLVHFPLTLWLRKIENSRSSLKFWTVKNIRKSLLAGLGGFFVVAAAWLILISVKHHRPTIGTAGLATHAIAGPQDMGRAHPSFVGLHRPPPYAIHTWEDPSEMPYKTWSPFASKKYFFHQINLCLGNAWRIMKILHHRGVSAGLVWLILSGAFLLWKRKPFGDLFPTLWTFATLGVFFSGYSFCYADQERYYWPVIPLIVILSFRMIPFRKTENKAVRLLGGGLLMLFAALFIFPTFRAFRESVVLCVRPKTGNVSRSVASRLNPLLSDGSFAVIGAKPRVFYVAYYLNRPFLGSPLSKNASSLTQELLREGAESLIVFDDSKARWGFLVQQLKTDPHYRWKGGVSSGAIRGWEGNINVFSLRR